MAAFSRSGRNPVAAARELVDRATRLARLEIELKTLELRRVGIGIGIGAGLALGAVMLLPLLIVFLLAAAAAALATVVSVWLAVLIVSAVLLGLVGMLALASVIVIRGALKRGADA